MNVRFEDASKTVEQKSTISVMQMYSPVNPYPDESPEKLLKRTVQLPELTWSGGGLITCFHVLDQIQFNSKIHRDIIGNLFSPGTRTAAGLYRYLRCGIKITVKVNSTPYHQGTLMVGWFPWQMGLSNVSSLWSRPPNMASFEHTMILSASSQEQATLHIPFMSTLPHHDLLNPYATQDPIFVIRPLNPLTTSSPTVVDAVPINVFAELENIEIYGYLPPNYSTSERFEKNSSEGARVGANKITRNTEAQAKDKQGQSTQPKKLTEIVPVIRTIPWLSTLIDVGKWLFSNLDKPTTDQGLTFTQNRPHRGHTLLNGIDFTEPLSSFTSYQVTKKMGIESSDIPVVHYAAKPALFYTTSAITKGIILQLKVHPMIYASSTRVEPDYLAFATAMHQFWRGGIKFVIQFVGTPFYSARFKISVTHTYPTVPAGTGDGTGYTSRIVDVKGDAWTSFIVPSLTPHLWNNRDITRDPAGYSWLVIELLTDVQGSSLPSQAMYYINIWRAAAEDYQLAHHVAAENWDTFEKNCSVGERFRDKALGVQTDSKGCVEEGIFMADTTSTLSDLCKRMVPHKPDSTGPYSYPQQDSALTYFSRDAFHMLQYGFLFWRGSRRMKVTDNSSYFVTLQPGESYPAGLVRLDGSPLVLFNDTLNTSATIPWYCQELMSPSISLQGEATRNTNYPVDSTSNSINPLWIAGGDDFAYYFPVPPQITSSLADAKNNLKRSLSLSVCQERTSNSSDNNKLIAPSLAPRKVGPSK
jgi:hypothetical protein